MADHWGLSRRQARRYVGRAHRVISDDLEESGLERRELTSQIVHGLMEAMSKALASGHASAVVGCSRELRELVGLGMAHRPQPHQLGAYGRSARWQ